VDLHPVVGILLVEVLQADHQEEEWEEVLLEVVGELRKALHQLMGVLPQPRQKLLLLLGVLQVGVEAPEVWAAEHQVVLQQVVEALQELVLQELVWEERE
jgi:hypothetical protein